MNTRNLIQRIMACVSLNHVSIILVCILIVASYSNSINSPFALDDFHSFVWNPTTYVKEINIEKLVELSRTEFGLPRFIPMLTFGLDYYWGKGHVFAYHVTNIMIHFLAYFSCISFVYSLLRTPALTSHYVSNRFFIAVGVASIWALHPVQTSAVTYLVQRMASLQAMFFLACTTSYIWGRLSLTNGSRRKAIACMVFAVGAAISAFLSKENSATLPIIILMIEFWFFRQKFYEPIKKGILIYSQKPAVKVLLIFASLCVIGLFLLGISWIREGYSIRHFSMTERLITQSRVVMRYVYAILVPDPRNLSLEHDVEVSTSLFSPITTIPCIITMLWAIIWSVKAKNKRPLVSFGILWFLVNLSVESTIVPLELMFDHRMYLPSIGLLLAVFEVFRLGFQKCEGRYSQFERRKLGWSTLAVICSFLSLMTFLRNEDWKNPLTINADSVQKAPNHPRAHSNYAVALYNAGMHEEALSEAAKAIALGKPKFEEHIVAAAITVSVYMDQGDYEKAIAEGERLLQEAPSSLDVGQLPVLLLKLAKCHQYKGNYLRAYEYITSAIQSLNRNPKSWREKTFAYMALENLLAEAEEKGVDIGLTLSGLAEAKSWEKTALVLLSLDDWEGARSFAEKAKGEKEADRILEIVHLVETRTAEQRREWKFGGLRGLTDMIKKIAHLARIHPHADLTTRLGKWLLKKALQEDPNDPDTHLLEGWYAFEEGRTEEAVAKARQAVDLAPQAAKAWIALGFFEEKAGRVENALTAFRHTLELYPGYPKRQVLKELMAKLEASQSDRPVSTISMLSGT